MTKESLFIPLSDLRARYSCHLRAVNYLCLWQRKS